MNKGWVNLPVDSPALDKDGLQNQQDWDWIRKQLSLKSLHRTIDVEKDCQVSMEKLRRDKIQDGAQKKYPLTKARGYFPRQDLLEIFYSVPPSHQTREV